MDHYSVNDILPSSDIAIEKISRLKTNDLQGRDAPLILLQLRLFCAKAFSPTLTTAVMHLTIIATIVTFLTSLVVKRCWIKNRTRHLTRQITNAQQNCFHVTGTKH